MNKNLKRKKRGENREKEKWKYVFHIFPLSYGAEQQGKGEKREQEYIRKILISPSQNV